MNEQVEKFKNLLEPGLAAKLDRYTESLISWNRKFALTSVPDNEIFEKLVAPSAWLGLEYEKMDIGVIADFGCGPGIPGLPMSLADSRNRYLLIESNARKCGFLRFCISDKSLYEIPNAKVEEIRFTRGHRDEKIDAVVSRAAGSVEEVVKIFDGKISPDAHFDFFKGDNQEREIFEFCDKRPEWNFVKLETPDWFESLNIVRISRDIQ